METDMHLVWPVLTAKPQSALLSYDAISPGGTLQTCCHQSSQLLKFPHVCEETELSHMRGETSIKTPYWPKEWAATYFQALLSGSGEKTVEF